MDSVAALLPKVLRKRGIKDEADASFIVFAAERWLKEHGTSCAQDLTPAKFAAGTLVIEAPSPIAAQECMGHAEELLEDLRRKFPGIAIERVRVLRSSS